VRKNYLKDRNALQLFTSILYNGKGERYLEDLKEFNFDELKHE
jgi:hypothetical protein